MKFDQRQNQYAVIPTGCALATTLQNTSSLFSKHDTLRETMRRPRNKPWHLNDDSKYRPKTCMYVRACICREKERKKQGDRERDRARESERERFIFLYVSLSFSIQICIYIHAYIHIYIYIYTQMYIYIYMHIHTHTQNTCMYYMHTYVYHICIAIHGNPWSTTSRAVL